MWTHDNQVVEETDRIFIDVDEDDTDLYHTALTIEDVTPEDAGTYKVTATNEEGEQTVAVSLLVEGRFSFWLKQLLTFRNILVTDRLFLLK